jgi:thioredoxin-dependent peroxiredoxin
MATRPEIGADAPEFSDYSEFLGKKAIVLYFYPKDDTPGCTREACAFRDLSAEFAARDSVIFGVSKDSAASHEKFVEKFGLNFGLIADTDGTICEAFGVWVEKMNYGKKYFGIDRTTFVIDKNAKIAKIFPRVKVDGHADKVLAFVQTLAGTE